MMNKLFVYGTLGPNKPNAHILEKIGGTWQEGTVLGKLYKEGWGAAMGYLGIRLEEPIESIEGFVFSSEQLSEYWSELDAFEGKEYQRVKTQVYLKEGKSVEAYIYVLA